VTLVPAHQHHIISKGVLSSVNFVGRGDWRSSLSEYSLLLFWPILIFSQIDSAQLYELNLFRYPRIPYNNKYTRVFVLVFSETWNAQQLQRLIQVSTMSLNLSTTPENEKKQKLDPSENNSQQSLYYTCEFYQGHQTHFAKDTAIRKYYDSATGLFWICWRQDTRRKLRSDPPYWYQRVNSLIYNYNLVCFIL